MINPTLIHTWKQLLLFLLLIGVAPLPLPFFKPAPAQAQYSTGTPSVIPSDQAETRFSLLFYKVQRFAWVIAALAVPVAVVMWFFGITKYILHVVVGCVLLSGLLYIIGMIASGIGQ